MDRCQANQLNKGLDQQNTPNTYFFLCFRGEIPGFDTVSAT